MKRSAIFSGLAAGMLIAGCAVVCGCASSGTKGKPLAPYSPDVSGRTPAQWARRPAQPVAQAPAAREPVRPAAPAVKAPVPAATNVAVVNAESLGRRLKREDKLTISLRGIQPPEEVEEVVDAAGAVTLPFIGDVVVEGRTTAEVERMVEKAYVDGGYYRKISVIVVAQDEEFFIEGEVQKQGRYPLTRDLTLLQAIAQAGGPTDFAKVTNVEIRRENQRQIHNLDRIREMKDKDPLIKPGDIVFVRRRWFL